MTQATDAPSVGYLVHYRVSSSGSAPREVPRLPRRKQEQFEEVDDLPVQLPMDAGGPLARLATTTTHSSVTPSALSDQSTIETSRCASTVIPIGDRSAR